MFTTAQAHANLFLTPREELAEFCVDVSKDIYGFKMRHLYEKSMDYLVDWHDSIYEWNEQEQVWNFRPHIREEIEREDSWLEEQERQLEEELEEELTNPWVLMCRGEE